MEINVAQLLKEPIGATRNYEIDEVVDVTGEGNNRLVEGEVKLQRTQRGILVKGEFRTELELTCSRCLGSFTYPLEINFEEEYIPTIDIVTGIPLSSPEEAGDFRIDEHHVIDLTEAIRQYTLLAMPMKPLCREDCAGLCQECGHNLNQGPCGCSVQEVDPRWAKLSKLL
jgi:uncharacterized protein